MSEANDPPAVVVNDDMSMIVHLPDEEHEESDEPTPKRSRIATDAAEQSPEPVAAREKLEKRLGGILCCVVCLDLPKSTIYQCVNGHLICSGCFTHLLADARLRDETATCPNCRVEVSKTTASRNIAVEKAVSELPQECQFCGEQFPRNALERHERHQCRDRECNCKYLLIGCPWRGPFHEKDGHEVDCTWPNSTGKQVMKTLMPLVRTYKDKHRLHESVIELLSYEKIVFNDLQFKPYRTDEFIHKLFYETARFSAFGHQWVVKAQINNSQRDPTLSCDREMSFQVIMKTKATAPLTLSFMMLHGPFGDMKVSTEIYKHEFTETINESQYFKLPLPDSEECNRLLAARAINFRLITFLLTK